MALGAEVSRGPPAEWRCPVVTLRRRTERCAGQTVVGVEMSGWMDHWACECSDIQLFLSSELLMTIVCVDVAPLWRRLTVFFQLTIRPPSCPNDYCIVNIVVTESSWFLQPGNERHRCPLLRSQLFERRNTHLSQFNFNLLSDHITNEAQCNSAYLCPFAQKIDVVIFY